VGFFLTDRRNAGRQDLGCPFGCRRSSWPTYLLAPSRRADWLRVERLLGEYGIAKDSVARRRDLERALETRRGAEEGGEFKAVRRGWCLGEETFRQELLAQISERLGTEHYGGETRRGGGSEGRTDHRGGVGAAKVDRRRVEVTSQG